MIFYSFFTDNIATFPTLLICWYKKGSLFGALAVGMGTVALIRYWMT